MLPAAAQSLMQRGTELGLALQGITVIFRGAPIQVRISAMPPDVTLGRGGFREKQQWKLRFPMAVQPAPSLLETILNPATGKTYVVKTCVPATGTPNSQEHIVEATFQ